MLPKTTIAKYLWDSVQPWINSDMTQKNFEVELFKLKEAMLASNENGTFEKDFKDIIKK